MSDISDMMYEHGYHDGYQLALSELNGKKFEKVIRCKDCKSRNGSECQNDDLLRQIHDCGCGATFHTDDDWFCPYGERKDGGENGN